MRNKMLKLSVFSLFVVLMASFVAAENMRCDIKDTLTEGSHKVYSVGGREYEIELTYVGGYGTPLANGGVSSGTVVLVANGETFKLGTANNYIGALSDGSRIQVVDIIQDEVADKIVFCFEGAVAPVIEESQQVVKRNESETELITLPADLRYYPKFFIKDEELNAFIVVGDSAPAMDVIAATDISASIQSAFKEIGVGPVKLVREVSTNNNLIIVGRQARDTIDIDADLAELDEGEGLIQIVRNGNYVALYVVGYDESGTRQATKVLTNWKDYQLSGDRYMVETITPPKAPDEPEPTCFDGIKNDGEEGVDCGGPCKPCPVVEQPCSGCKRNGDCLPFGTRLVEDGVPKYCSITKEFEFQKGADEACQNNYECSTNICVDSKCISSGLITRILNWFKSFFG